MTHPILVVLAFAACKESARDTTLDDPAQASTYIRAMVTSCDGVTRALDRIAQARVRGRLLAGLVDDAIGSAQCQDLASAVKGAATAHQLARARIDDARPELALAHLRPGPEAAIRYRRAELLDRIGRAPEALRELDGVALDADATALQRMLLVSVAARAGNAREAGRLVEIAPLPEQARLAHRAAADAPVATLEVLAQVGPVELALAAADRLEPLHGPAAVWPARERIAALDSSVADHWDALGRARIAAGKLDEAIAAWDRAIDIAPAQSAFRIAPIRALVIAEQPQRAVARAEALAQHARKAADVELLVTASAGAAAAARPALAIALAREARALRSTDGRLAFLVAQRLAEAGDARAATDAYVELLTCGAHGRPWHRHEVAGKLRALQGTSADARANVEAALAAKRACEVVEPADLATYVEGLSR